MNEINMMVIVISFLGVLWAIHTVYSIIFKRISSKIAFPFYYLLNHFFETFKYLPNKLVISKKNKEICDIFIIIMSIAITYNFINVFMILTKQKHNLVPLIEKNELNFLSGLINSSYLFIAITAGLIINHWYLIIRKKESQTVHELNDVKFYKKLLDKFLFGLLS